LLQSKSNSGVVHLCFKANQSKELFYKRDLSFFTGLFCKRDLFFASKQINQIQASCIFASKHIKAKGSFTKETYLFLQGSFAKETYRL